MTRLEIDLVLKTLRSRSKLKDATWAADDIVPNSAAMILECPKAGQPLGFVELCSQFLFIFPNKALILTSCPEETWEERLNEDLTEHPESGGSLVRWRASRMGGRTWVAPGISAKDEALEKITLPTIGKRKGG